jgi:hypothetical protein
MKLSNSIKLGAVLIIFLNLTMAVGSIWVFQRMTPSIEHIIDRNGKSLKACEAMLEILATRKGSNVDNSEPQALDPSFEKQLSNAKHNITETNENEAIQRIEDNYREAIEGDSTALTETLLAISELRSINWNATYRADMEAKQIGNAGAWGICFMGIIVFLASLVFKKRVERNLLEPFEEIASVLSERVKGDTMRRCSRYSRSTDVRKVYALLNSWMDQMSIKPSDANSDGS